MLWSLTLQVLPARYRSWRCPRCSRRRDWRNFLSVRSVRGPQTQICVSHFLEERRRTAIAVDARTRDAHDPYQACVTNLVPNVIARARAVRVGNARRGRPSIAFLPRDARELLSWIVYSFLPGGDMVMPAAAPPQAATANAVKVRRPRDMTLTHAITGVCRRACAHPVLPPHCTRPNPTTCGKLWEMLLNTAPNAKTPRV